MTAVPSTDHPTAGRLAGVFQTIAETRMADLPLRNPALQVETVGFRPWRDGTIGVLITPWSMSLVFIPGADADLGDARAGVDATLSLPSGDYAFVVANEATLGTYLTSPLFSPMFQFSSMCEAQAVARSVMAELFSERQSPRPEPRGVGPAPSRSLDRRDFLRAWLPRSSKD